jgi:hypothetical protein
MRRRWAAYLRYISLSGEGATDRCYIRDEGEGSASSWASMVKRGCGGADEIGLWLVS